MLRVLSVALLSFLYVNSANADLYSASNALSRGDYETAITEFTRLAEKGDDKAQANLGYMHYAGEGVTQDYKQAVYWYRMAAVQGNKDAQYNLAVSYAFGEGVEQDLTEAAIWYRRAGEQGHVVSQYSLGISYAYGEGVPQDQKEAARWFNKAADQGYSRAQVHLGSMYHTGEGVEQDYAEAVRWYRMAADRGDATAQYNLGAMYRSGKGVEQNYAQAKRWYRQSADQGYAAAQNELASLERSAGANIPTRTVQEKPELFPTETTTETIAEKAIPETPVEEPVALTQEPVQEKVVKEETTPVIAEPEQISEVISTEVPVKKPLFTVDKKDLLTLDESTLDIPEPIKNDATPVSAIETKIEATEPVVLEEAVVAIEKAKTTVAVEPEAENITTEKAVTNDLAQQTEKPPVSAMHRALGIPEPKPQTKKEKESGNLISAIGSIFSGGKKSNTEQVENVEDEIKADTTISAAIEEPTLETSTIETEIVPESTIEQVEEITIKDPYVAAEDPTLLTEATSDVSAQEVAVEEVTADEAYEAANDPTLLTETTDAVSEQDNIIEEAISEEVYVAEEDPTLLTETTDTEVVDEKPESSGGLFSAIGSLFGSKDKEIETELIQEEPQVMKEEMLVAKVDETEPVIEEIELAQTAEQDVTQYSVEAGRRALANNNYDEVVKQFRPLAEAGNSEAQAHLGSLYYVGKGVAQNIDSSYNWYKKAADQGNVDAQYSIGNMYLLGEGVEQSNQQAAEWYALAGEKGHVAALNNLANLKKLDALNRQNQLNEEVAQQESTAELQSTVDEVIADTTTEAPNVKSYAAGEAPSTDTLQTYSDIQPSETDIDTTPTISEDSIADELTTEIEETAQSITATSPQTESPSEQTAFFKSLFGDSTSDEKTRLKEADSINLERTETDPVVDESVNDGPVKEKADEVVTEAIEEDEVVASEKPEGLFGFFGKMFSSNKDENNVGIDDDQIQPSEQVAMTETELVQPSIEDEELNVDIVAIEEPVETSSNESVLEALRALAAKGDKDAQYKLGTIYYSGDGVEKDYSQSALWYRRSAEQGNIDAQYSLGNMYLMGEGIAQDDEQAIHWYAMAADQGHQSALHNLTNLQKTAVATDQLEIKTSTITEERLTRDTSVVEEVNAVEEINTDSSGESEYEQGLAYAFGDGVPQNDRTAFNLFYSAAKKGYALAQYKVGVAYAYGEGVRQDQKQAAEWYLKAAKQGYTIAQRNVAMMYLDGNGIQQDKIQALAWYSVVATQGNAMDIRRRDMLAKELSEIELSQSQELSNQITERLSNNNSL